MLTDIAVVVIEKPMKILINTCYELALMLPGVGNTGDIIEIVASDMLSKAVFICSIVCHCCDIVDSVFNTDITIAMVADVAKN